MVDAARKHGIVHKFASHFNESLANAKDDDWVFLCRQLEPVLAQMRLHFRSVYEEHLQINGSMADSISRPLHVVEASLDQAAASLVVEAAAAIMSAVRTANVVKMIQQYRARVQALLKTEVEDVFSSCAKMDCWSADS